MHEELIEKISDIQKRLQDEDIYAGGKGYYQLIEEVPSQSAPSFLCWALKEKKQYLIEFAPSHLNHIDLQKYLRRALFLLILDHSKGIVSAHDFSMDPARSFVVMDWVEGISLLNIMKTTKLDLKESLWLSLDVCIALDHLSEYSFVHRNVNPANIIIQEKTGKVFVTGMESLTQSDFMQTRLDTNIHYISPEVMQALLFPNKQVFITPWSDVYSFGALFFHIVNWEVPFPKRTNMEKWVRSPGIPKIKNPVLPRKERKYCQYLIDKTMHPNFQKRWAAYQVRDYLFEFLGGADRDRDMRRWMS